MKAPREEILGTLSKSLQRSLLRQSWMRSPEESLSVCSPPNFNLKHVAPKMGTTGFLAHLLSLLVKHREDIITGKPEASNAFMIE